jgi:uncharacterized protein YqcC (DUF446 family)
MPPNEFQIQQILEGIIAELHRIGAWSATPPPDTAFHNMGAFGMNTMTFEQWLQFVLVPRVEEALETEGPWPGSSDVAVHATRQFDGALDRDKLLDLLRNFDAQFGAH